MQQQEITAWFQYFPKHFMWSQGRARDSVTQCGRVRERAQDALSTMGQSA